MTHIEVPCTHSNLAAFRNCMQDTFDSEIMKYIGNFNFNEDDYAE